MVQLNKEEVSGRGITSNTTGRNPPSRNPGHNNHHLGTARSSSSRNIFGKGCNTLLYTEQPDKRSISITDGKVETWVMLAAAAWQR